MLMNIQMENAESNYRNGNCQMLCIHCNKLIANVWIKSINTTIVAKRDYLCETQIDLIENTVQYGGVCVC